MSSNVIHQYMVGRKNKKVGVMVALVTEADPDNIRIGWSGCNTKLDKFDKGLGLSIAKKRAEALKLGLMIDTKVPVPAGYLKQLEFFTDRAKRYFKDKKSNIEIVPQGPNLKLSQEEKSKLTKIFEEPNLPRRPDSVRLDDVGVNPKGTQGSFKQSEAFRQLESKRTKALKEAIDTDEAIRKLLNEVEK